MTPPAGGSGRTGHLGAEVSAYADRRLPAATQLAYDRHVSVCIGCRAAVEDERRLLGSLRLGVPAPPRSLEASLLSLSASARLHGGPAPWDLPSPTSAAAAAGGRGGAGRRAADALPVLRAGAPPMHRSPVRAAVVAGLAAGASAAAALGLGVAGLSAAGGVGGVGGATTTPAGVATTGGVSTSPTGAGGSVPRGVTALTVAEVFPGAVRPEPRLGPWAGTDRRLAGQAQSTP